MCQNYYTTTPRPMAERPMSIIIAQNRTSQRYIIALIGSVIFKLLSILDILIIWQNIDKHVKVYLEINLKKE